MKPFLQVIAEAYSSSDSGVRDLSRLLFVFPNKRSGTFFLKYLSQIMAEGTLLPEVTTVSDFITKLSGREVDSHLDLLFLLYESYLAVVAKGISADPSELKDDPEAVSFSRFRLWGETMLSDFNEVDTQLVNVEQVFRNVKDLREISTDFLTPEQRKVAEEYFGYRGGTSEAGGFWKKFAELDDEGMPLRDSTRLKRKFIYLWQVMRPLYEEFGRRLEERGLTTPGGSYRIAARRLEDEGRELLSGYERIVFVGFNALSGSERAIFATLRDMEPDRELSDYGSMADFFWDSDGPLFAGKENPAARFTGYNKRTYPSPEWAERFLRECRPTGLPEMDVLAVPSNVAQLKVIGEELQQMIVNGKITAESLRQARIAVVLPDEKLLQPLLYSLPEGLGDTNLTMGYPLRQTSVASFASLLRRMLLRQKGSGKGAMLFLPDVKSVLAHPFVQACFGSRAISRFVTDMERRHRRFVSTSDLQALNPLAERLLGPIDRDVKPTDLLDDLDGRLEMIDGVLMEFGSSLLKGRLERQHIASYREALRRLRMSLRQYDLRIPPHEVFLLADRLLAAESVAFEGEPLEGLQVMGMLETRCLDFDMIFIPSMNEKVMPRRARARTFIPNTLRREYGMPPASFQEEIFSYYFFRLISRAEKAVMLYDSRIGDKGGGGASRFLMQMDHLLPPGSLQFTDCSFRISAKRPELHSIKKENEVRDCLEKFLTPGSGWNLSATSLLTYISCPLRFFYEYVLRIKTDPELTETVNAVTAGEVIHGAMMDLYLLDMKDPGIAGSELKQILDSPRRITKETIERLINTPERVEQAVRRRINKHHFRLKDGELDMPLTGGPLEVFPYYCRQVRDILRHDLTQTPFDLYGCEVEGLYSLPFGGEEDAPRGANCRFAIDRIDRSVGDDASGKTPLRVVDYKTGYVSVESASMESMISGEDGKNLLQLFLYSDMLQRHVTEKYPELEDLLLRGVKMEIYNVSRITTGEKYTPKIGELEIADYRQVEDEFQQAINTLLMEIFDYEKPFDPPRDEEKSCAYCPLTELCRR